MAWLSPENLKSYGFSSVGKNVLVDETVRIYRPSFITIGSNVRVDAETELVAGPEELVIGNYVHISRGCVIHAAGGVVIHDFVGLSPSVHLLSECDDYSGGFLTNPTVQKEFRRVTSLPIRIMKHVAIGTGSVILPGGILGEGASIGALSVVLGRVAPCSIVAGNPLRNIGQRNLAKLRDNESRFLNFVEQSTQE